MGLSKNLGGMYRDVFLQCVRRSGRYCILPVLRTQTGASCAVLPIIKPDLAFAFFRCKTWGQGEAQRDPFSTTYLAEFLDRTDFGSLLWKEAMKRGYGSAKETVFIGDGAEWIWNLVNERFKDAVQIVDFYHASEHLHALCQAIEPDEIRAKALFRKWRNRLQNDGLPRILHEVSKRFPLLKPTQRKEINVQLPYFRTNAARMRYGTFRKKGYFIGSGTIEGACRHIVAQRTKLSGMRWRCAGARNVLAFRCLIKSNLFDDYCKNMPLCA